MDVDARARRQRRLEQPEAARARTTDDEIEAAHDVERWDGDDEAAAIAAVLAALPAFDAVGHRVVHGGADVPRSRCVVDADDRARSCSRSSPLAPLHQPRAVAGIARVARACVPTLPQVACFDTAFHATLPAAAAHVRAPAAWRERWGLRRFGFHGLSHAYASRRARRARSAAPTIPTLRVVTCHLGAGASLCATRGGRSVDTTMGFTPLEGLVMATRSGTVDPGLVLVADRSTAGSIADEVARRSSRESGLAGLSGIAGGDMRDVLAARAARRRRGRARVRRVRAPAAPRARRR